MTFFCFVLCRGWVRFPLLGTWWSPWTTPLKPRVKKGPARQCGLSAQISVLASRARPDCQGLMAPGGCLASSNKIGDIPVLQKPWAPENRAHKQLEGTYISTGFILCIWVCCLYECLYSACGPGAPGGQKRAESPCGHWSLNLGPLGEWPVLLTAGHLSSPQRCFFGDYGMVPCVDISQAKLALFFCGLGCT